MKKNVWIWNHYATNMFKDQGGRHYWFAENLKNEGYNPTIFCASTIHNSDESIDTENQKYLSKNSGDIPFVFVKTPKYGNNEKKRVLNMLTFYKNLFVVAKEYAQKYGKPDVILASSVHPLTMVAGIKIAKKFGVPCICEVRDLWPESIVAYGVLSRKNPVIKALYQGEKWIYQNADSVIMTWEGGKNYIVDQGWKDEIDLTKINHISNGVIINTFDKNSLENKIVDEDLNNKSFKNIVYAGSIRKVNNVGMLLDAAKIIQSKGKNDIRILIYGSGDERQSLVKRCEIENINNVIFKGRVEKKFIPSILKNSYANILHNSSTSLNKYGQSQNKCFEYLAAGKCIIQTYYTNYNIIEKYDCGYTISNQSHITIAETIISACENQSINRTKGENARSIAKEFDFIKLTEKLTEVIEHV